MKLIGSRSWVVMLMLVGLAVVPVRSAPPEKEVVLDLGNGASMKLVLIPAGRFTMGSADKETGRQDNEGPQRVVTLTRPFYMGVHEVTYRQYQAVTGQVPRKVEDVELPISGVSWDSAEAFCVRLSETSKRTIGLPTEAQWEYACRAGTRTRYSFGDDEVKLVDYGRCGQQGNAGPLRVGSLKPNAWGLYDMHGNLAEFCRDFYKKQYPAKAETDRPGR